MANQRISVTLVDEEIESLVALAAFWRVSISAAAGRCIRDQISAARDDVNSEYQRWLADRLAKEGLLS